MHRHTLETLWIQFQTTAIKGTLRAAGHRVVCVPVLIKVMCILYSIQCAGTLYLRK